jgi:hypothetical protein
LNYSEQRSGGYNKLARATRKYGFLLALDFVPGVSVITKAAILKHLAELEEVSSMYARDVVARALSNRPPMKVSVTITQDFARKLESMGVDSQQAKRIVRNHVKAQTQKSLAAQRAIVASANRPSIRFTSRSVPSRN